MQYSTIIAAIFATVAVANPIEIVERTGGKGDGTAATYNGCAGTSLLLSTAQCCATDVLGLVNLNCVVPSKVPTSANDFKSTCAKSGLSAKCCLAPVLGQALVCTNPIGV